MVNSIEVKRSETLASIPVPGDLNTNEIAMNIADKKLYTKDSGGNIVEIANQGDSFAISMAVALG